MITIYKDSLPLAVEVIENDLNDIRATLAPNQFMALQEYDAKRIVSVLGHCSC